MVSVRSFGTRRLCRSKAAIAAELEWCSMVAVDRDGVVKQESLMVKNIIQAH